MAVRGQTCPQQEVQVQGGGGRGTGTMKVLSVNTPVLFSNNEERGLSVNAVLINTTLGLVL